MLIQGTEILKQCGQNHRSAIYQAVTKRVLPLVYMELQDEDFKGAHEMEAEVQRLVADMIYAVTEINCRVESVKLN